MLGLHFKYTLDGDRLQNNIIAIGGVDMGHSNKDETDPPKSCAKVTPVTSIALAVVKGRFHLWPKLKTVLNCRFGPN
jgi:hypothetical protein